jgi:hypothetical protein
LADEGKCGNIRICYKINSKSSSDTENKEIIPFSFFPPLFNMLRVNLGEL